MLMLGDCLERMAEIPAGSVDLVLTDPPYGTTACKWDAVIPFAPMWEQVWRVLKPNGAAVFTASQPFTSALAMSQAQHFKYCWVWEKSICANFAQAKNSPLKTHEDVCVFSCGIIGHVSQTSRRMTYNPQGVEGAKRKMNSVSVTQKSAHKLYRKGMIEGKSYDGSNYPKSILKIPNSDNRQRGLHPTQKPVALMEYLIRTYTHPGETVLDFTMGSGTTGVACVNTGRKFIGIERDPAYFAIAERRIAEAQPQLLAAE